MPIIFRGQKGGNPQLSLFSRAVKEMALSKVLPLYSIQRTQEKSLLQAVLSDFEDAYNHLEEDAKDVKREIQLVADSLRLGGAILGK
jgi:hypothetical protein